MEFSTAIAPINRIVKYALCLYCYDSNEYQLANGWVDSSNPFYHGTIGFKSTHQSKYKPLKMDTAQSCKTFSGVTPIKSLLYNKASWTTENNRPPYIFFFNSDNIVEAIIQFDFTEFETILRQYLPKGS